MDERVVQFRVGVMVLATLLITAILVVLFGEAPTLFRRSYTIHIHFQQAPGVTRDTPVRKSGILIGRVSDIDFDEKGGVIVTAVIQAERVLRKNERCRIKSSLLGDSVLEFVPVAGKQLSNEPIKNGEHVDGAVYADPLEAIANLEGQLGGAIEAFSTTSAEIGRLAKQLGDLLEANDGQMARIVQKSEGVINTFQSVLNSADQILGDPKVKQSLRESLEQLPQTMADTREAIASIKAVSGDLQKTLGHVDRNLQNLEGFTEPLGERGEDLVARFDSGMQKLDSALGQLESFTRKVNSSEGSLSQFLNNPDLYQNLNSAAMNVNRLTTQLRPILDDVRAFTDKISRHPEKLGVRGMIEPSSGIK